MYVATELVRYRARRTSGECSIQSEASSQARAVNTVSPRQSKP
jgi:hypothetical protein